MAFMEVDSPPTRAPVPLDVLMVINWSLWVIAKSAWAASQVAMDARPNAIQNAARRGTHAHIRDCSK
jgi:hypothetical protein